MNSSGIKRGLAGAAVAALAVTGLPFLASSASAAPGDTLTQGDTGPVRNGNAAGGSVIIKSNSVAIDPADIVVTDASYAGANPIAGGNDVTSPAFDVDVLSFTLLDPNKDGDNDILTGDLKFADGTYHYNLQTAVTLGTATKATFGIVEDVAGDGVNASDPKTTVEVTPTGAPASVDVSTTQPATVEGNPVAFSVVVKDASGATTQLVAGEEFDVTASAGVTLSDSVLDSTDLNDGTATFTGTPGIASPDTMTVTVTGSTPPAPSITDSATVSVFDNATITTDEFKFDTGADTWQDGVTAFGTPTQVRVDQNSVTFSFQSKDGADPDSTPDDAGKVVGLVLDSVDGVTFNGTNPATAPGGNVVVPVVLDSAGKGSVTVALGGVTAGATWTFSGPGSSIATTTVTMARAAASSVAPDADVYVSKIGAATQVVVTVKDQFGNPIGAPAQVSITRGARNGATTTARQTVDANGQATFSLPDAGTLAGSETITINLYDDQFDPSATPAGSARIDYTADGLGNDFAIGGATSDPAATVIQPLYDSAAGVGDSVGITIAGGTPNAPATVSVDNGALVLGAGETNLTQGAASDTITLSGVGAGGVTVVGTKAGIVTVTVTSAGRTETVKLTVKQPTGAALVATARNIELTGPEKANAGGTTTFTAKVTDAFGNPVAGVPVANLPITISGPANLQSSDAATNAAGELVYNVILTDNANSPVTARVTGTNAGGATPQFGAAANSTTGTANDAPGLTASEGTDSVTVENVVNIAELEQAVEDAQEAVDEAQDNLDDARDLLAVAKAEKQVAQKAVKAAKKDLKKAKKQGKGVKAAKAALRNAKGDLKIASAKVESAQKKVNREKEDLAEAQADLAAAEQALEDAQNEG